MVNCGRTECKNEGTHYPQIMVLPANTPDYRGPAAEIVLGVPVCKEHQDDSTVDSFIDDENWPMIKASFRAAGRSEPDRSTLGLVWRRIETSPFGQPPREGGTALDTKIHVKRR